MGPRVDGVVQVLFSGVKSPVFDDSRRANQNAIRHPGQRLSWSYDIVTGRVISVSAGRRVFCRSRRASSIRRLTCVVQHVLGPRRRMVD